MDGSFEELRNGGAVLGPTPDATYNRGYARLETGDVLCLYTDGIVEAHDDRDEEFGLLRLKELVDSNRQMSAREIGRAIFSEVTRWAAGTEDDRTVVIVKAV
jgi:sigma-B regulation protein RsbU (phosphoserine phosphatase)